MHGVHVRACHTRTRVEQVLLELRHVAQRLPRHVDDGLQLGGAEVHALVEAAERGAQVALGRVEAPLLLAPAIKRQSRREQGVIRRQSRRSVASRHRCCSHWRESCSATEMAREASMTSAVVCTASVVERSSCRLASSSLYAPIWISYVRLSLVRRSTCHREAIAGHSRGHQEALKRHSRGTREAIRRYSRGACGGRRCGAAPPPGSDRARRAAGEGSGGS